MPLPGQHEGWGRWNFIFALPPGPRAGAREELHEADAAVLRRQDGQPGGGGVPAARGVQGGRQGLQRADAAALRESELKKQNFQLFKKNGESNYALAA